VRISKHESQGRAFAWEQTSATATLMVFDATVVCVSHLHAAAEAEDRLREVLSGLVDPSLHEPSCLQYQILRRLDSRSEFLIVERWRSETAFRRHCERPNVLALYRLAEPLLRRPPAVDVYRQVK
jgi:quinol monooxygenase YgiN